MNWNEYRITKSRTIKTFSICRNRRVQISKTRSSDKRIKRLMKKSLLVSKTYEPSTKTTTYNLVYRGE